MPNRLSNGPLQLTSLDLSSINYMLQQIRRELDELKGLRGPIELKNDLSTTGSITLSDAQYVDGVTLIDFNATASAGEETTVARSDHEHNAVVTAGQAIEVTPTDADVTVAVVTDPTFLGDVTLSTGRLIMSSDIDLSAIAAGTKNLTITATSDVPVVVFSAGLFAPTTAPAGYLEIDVGGVPNYIPFWV